MSAIVLGVIVIIWLLLTVFFWVFTRHRKQNQMLASRSCIDDTQIHADELPCVIREILYAPPCPNEDIAKLLEVAMTYHNTSQYQLAIQTYIRAQREWIELYRDQVEKQEEADILVIQHPISEFEGDESLDDEGNDDDDNGGDDEGTNTIDENNDTSVKDENVIQSDRVRTGTTTSRNGTIFSAARDEHMYSALELIQAVMHPMEIVYFRLAIGSVYESCANDELALAEYQEARRYADAGLEKNHPDRATILSCIAGVYTHLRNYELAIKYYEMALKIREELLTPQHVDTAILYNNMGVCLHCIGEMSKAIKHYSLALEILETAFGMAHPRVVLVKGNISKTRIKHLQEYVGN